MERMHGFALLEDLSAGQNKGPAVTCVYTSGRSFSESVCVLGECNQTEASLYQAGCIACRASRAAPAEACPGRADRRFKALRRQALLPHQTRLYHN